jgi:hypothetical protein
VARRGRKDIWLRSAILFGISVTLVLGFWFHAEFYQLGLLPLVLVGGAVVSGVLTLIRVTLSPAPLLRGRVAGSMEFERGEVPSVLDGSKTAVIRPLVDDERFTWGAVYAARRGEGGDPFARLRIEDARRHLIDDLREEDVRDAGYGGLSEFLDDWKAQRRDAGPDCKVLLVRYVVTGGRH